MQSDLISILLGFIEGFALIISPCILPILPIVLASSLVSSKQRPLGIISGFTLTFALFAFFSRQLVQYTGIDVDAVRHLSYLILLLLGLTMISSYLSEKFGRLTQRLSQVGSAFPSVNNPQGGFYSGLFLGGLISIIWTPCAGPILAAVIVQTVIQKTTIISFFTLLAFALGAAVPMFIMAFYGRKLIDTFGFFKQKALLFRKILGVIIIASVGYMIYQEKGYSASFTIPETTVQLSTSLVDGLLIPYKAPAIEDIEAWINSPPLKINELKGKVVLIDFWTYSCINCVRTLPYLEDWYHKYRNKGLVIIGVHSPEFAFEKNLDNVRNAVKRDGILYPVALDNQFTTWRNYNNHYWPAHYLIDKQGEVVYQHFGEGLYDVTENNIRFLLGIDALPQEKQTATQSYSYLETPETYLGYARADRSLSPYLIHDKIAHYSFPEKLPLNAWALQGEWQVSEDKIIAGTSNASLKIHFKARKVFMVMSNPTGKPIRVQVLLNGKPLVNNQGKEVKNSSILVNRDSIYEVVNNKQFTSGLLQIITTEPGVEIYTFTFGN
ncbi:cytochrome c biogenesis protein DipZ [Legionella micdadei]|uniref:Cytochrome c biogenesis protein CcdA n=1 Tax=Legionella micdadei TaxID=451 RepID=A0A098GCN0_LEGMI|nr:cytochrome c biogenesis protein DipZ [Legionella micdadei]ARG98125.1 cytochrome C biogenesis protein DipZ [Legionella micdadei]ARH00923.1 cytochrome C biogenesis protein DipZ [Legionella micdadei]KTD30031.1 cytochrome C biogenesis protein [Legionella micdadei]NSL18590.1 cytochrome c biogenesis protein DipZ [Legionella micdadei]CEG60223.1 putative Redoxin family protein [Legionella micdadei]